MKPLQQAMADLHPTPSKPKGIESLPNVPSNSATSGESKRQEPDECPTCRGLEVLRLDVPVGHPQFGKLQPCPDCAVPKKNASLQASLSATSGLLEDERDLSLDNLYERGDGSRILIAAVRDMIEQPYGFLTVWGGPGNGKTTALQVLVSAYTQRGYQAIYTRLADLLDHLRQGYNPEARIETHTRYQQIIASKLLALDEFDKPRLTDWAREAIFQLVDDRYRHARQLGELQRHTALAMNANPDTLPEYLVSRLRYGLHAPDGFRIVHNTDYDARQNWR